MQTLHSPTQAAQWLRQHVTGVLCTDSRAVQKGDAFIAWPGAATDGRAYVASAFAQGAQVCLVEAEACQQWLEAWQPAADRVENHVAAYAGLKADTGWIADAYYEQPSHELQVLAVTGTNGKTSSTWWLAQAINALSSKSGAALAGRCAIVGTLGVGEPPTLMHTGMTTPDPVLLQAQFRKFVSAGITHCAIEASSIGIAEQRLAGTRIQLALLTNFTQDHLDYHGSMAAYWQAKEALFAWPELEVAVINVDDAQGAKLASDLSQARIASSQGSPIELWACSSQGHQARLQALNVRRTLSGLSFDVLEGSHSVHLQTSLMGDYNVDNVLGVMAALRALNYNLSDIAEVCSQLKAVPGRMEKVQGPNVVEGGDGIAGIQLPLTVVDYAHTPDAVTQTLLALKPMADALGSQLWCVLGCGGDRDASKRSLMAAAAESVAHQLVLTSDNPRSESPAQILRDMQQGLKAPEKAHQELDRAKAIFQTVMQAGQRDVILIAGKGHEDTQEIAGVKYPFDDRVHAHHALVQRAHAIQSTGAQA
jgi:UDP-N-acetylmuramoyl-L-alanyl-D-glutamate--2,6-diaminopimelate ligase